MATIPLAETGRGKADASGRCVLSMGPQRFGAKWNVDRTVVNSSSILLSTVTVYRQIIALANVIDTTSSGNNDVSDTGISLGNLETVLIVWAGATPGADCFASLYGTIDTGRS